MPKQDPPSYTVFDWEIVGKVAVSRALPGNIPDDLWRQFLDDMVERKAQFVLALVAGAGSLTATQRKAAADVLRQHSIFAVVVTDSSFVRGIVTAVSWLGAKASSFSWKDIDKAITACQVSSVDERKLRAAIDVLEKRRIAAKL